MTLFPPAGGEETVRRLTLWPGWACCGLLALAFVFDPQVPQSLQLVPLVVSVVLVGLPHGAIDHLVPGRLGSVSTLRGALVVGGVYLLLGVGYTVVWFLAPTVGFVSFILLTLAHWGQGDMHALVAFAGANHLCSVPQRALAAVVRGGFPMLVPLVAFPTQYERVAQLLVAPFAGDASLLAPVFTPESRLAVGVGFGALVAVHLGVGYWRRAGDGWRRDAGETLLLGAFFTTVPPLFAVGLYFCLWHALRHVGRLALADEPSVAAFATGDLWTPLRRFAWQAAPLTAVSLAFLGVFYLLVPEPPTTAAGVVGLYLVLIAALTLPHVGVVAWMDAKQGVWTRPVSERA
ncbi:Brp/Blh family beta-carotene 15,15'-dioxygenase [Halosegnis longus]|uniref:Brp/Blh family beta-carotene 15,15'-dioxygenase n=1 Tax=Halosegnis longus TaxID=2216012 RepID=UPI00129E6270|nr:Brp/Blh family beta-carotene 15,15'-dioxygenase [Halosegnis longus]